MATPPHHPPHGQDPKDNTQIKNALERLEQAEVEEESF